jgi:ectoine hydroxylase-related dioxygenase (phytanoyl-CoA dioxygenase family)
MHKLLYSGRMMELYRRFLGGPVLHYDFTWIRTVAPGHGTPPHFDVVYMGRGTKNLYTAWTPLGDTSLEMGGLMILENSHKHEKLKQGYGSHDVDSYCSNRKDADKYASGEKWPSGWLTNHPVRIRKNLGGRWLTGEFKAGDLLTFSMFTLHASLDNQGKRLRLSTDTRYQLASEPADNRWIGEDPPAHGPRGKKGMIC